MVMVSWVHLAGAALKLPGACRLAGSFCYRVVEFLKSIGALGVGVVVGILLIAFCEFLYHGEVHWHWLDYLREGMGCGG